jgi:hypothetical protein
MKIFPLTIYVLLNPFIQILPSDSKKSLWDSRTTATLVNAARFGKSPRCYGTSNYSQFVLVSGGCDID